MGPLANRVLLLVAKVLGLGGVRMIKRRDFDVEEGAPESLATVAQNETGGICGNHNTPLACINSLRSVKLTQNWDLERGVGEFTKSFNSGDDPSHTNPVGKSDADVLRKYYRNDDGSEKDGSSIVSGYGKQDWRASIDAWMESRFHKCVLEADKFTDFAFGGSEAVSAAFFGPGNAPGDC